MDYTDSPSWSRTQSGTSTPRTPLLKTPSEPRPKPLSKFKRLSPVVSVYEPEKESLQKTISTPSTPLPPTTILFCSWMNAHPKHIDYYTRTYMKLYPTAKILLITITSSQFLFQSETYRQTEIKSCVQSLLSTPQKEERILLHALSNGGNKRAYGIASLYKTLTGNPLPVKTYITDSAPGIPKFRRDVYALGHVARNWSWISWIPYMSMIYLTVSMVYVAVNWMPKWFWHELVWGPVEGCNSLELFDGREGRGSVKGYVYSEEDLSIDWRDVEDHARVAEERGFRVLRWKVEGAEHVQMFRGSEGEGAYWGWVERLWKLGMGSD